MMTGAGNQTVSVNPAIPAGYRYVGQFIGHDLSFDKTAAAPSTSVTIEELKQGRSPALDLDCPIWARALHSGSRLAVKPRPYRCGGYLLHGGLAPLRV
jgi:hypothetical protein